MWTKQHIMEGLRTKTFAVAVGSLIGFASGVSGATFLIAKKLERHYQNVANEEILAAKLFYSKRNKEGEFSDPSELAKKYDERDVPEEESAVLEVASEEFGLLQQAFDILERQDYTKYAKEPKGKQSQEEVVEVSKSIKKNVFDNRAPTNDTNYDEAAELAKKEAGLPYIITIEEYMQNETRYSQICLSYYEGDDVIADELDSPMGNYERNLGEDNLKFGQGSKDNNVVYIRNENLGEEYEVVRSFGTYEDEVTAGLAHSAYSGIRKFRNED